jgi:predicted Zn finger-like uncharacterized protein
MRITCPNCAAQYEVDDDAIPEAGRDLQCSSCGHTWFQLPPMVEAALEASESAMPDTQEPQSEDLARETEDLAQETFAEEHPIRETETAEAVESESAREPAEDIAMATDTPARRQLDESVLNVLREEAEREARVRRAEAEGGLETQPDLGLDAGAQVPAASPPDTAAGQRGQDDWKSSDDDDATPDAQEPRKKRLPDIEEINSSLRPASEHGTTAAEIYTDEVVAGNGRRRGFRIGFVLALLLAVVLLATYLYAPTIALLVPEAAPALDAYVETVDSWRTVLAERVDAAIRALTEMLTADAGT